MDDIRIKCKGCGDDFIWTEQQQKFYAENNLFPPKRCEFCRQEMRRKRKQVMMRREEVQRG